MRIVEQKLLIQKQNKNIQYSNKFIIKSKSDLPNVLISFGAMKKSQFDALDVATIEKFKIPIEKFNSNDDLQNWAFDKVDIISQKKYGGRSRITKVQREFLLRSWLNYLSDKKNKIKPSVQMLILDSITKELKPSDDTLPPIFSKSVLEETTKNINNELKKNPHFSFNFAKLYTANLEEKFLKSVTKTKKPNFWIVIPSEQNSPENFEENIAKLRLFSAKKWSTKSFMAHKYLSGGDFHIYLENGVPKLGLRFLNGELDEIQGIENDWKIPLSYLGVVKQHIKNNKIHLTENAQKSLNSAELLKKKVTKLKRDLKMLSKDKFYEKIFVYLGFGSDRDINFPKMFQYFDIDVKINKSGMFKISHYSVPEEGISFQDIGINEDKLFNRIKIIAGNADFANTGVSNLGKLLRIEGKADFRNSKVVKLGNLEEITDFADFSKSAIVNLGNLKTIGSFVNFSKSNVVKLGKLEKIGGNAYFKMSRITNLGNLKVIDGFANFNKSSVVSLGKLKEINGGADFQNCKIEDIGELKKIKGPVYVDNPYMLSLLKENNVDLTEAVIHISEHQ